MLAWSCTRGAVSVCVSLRHAVSLVRVVSLSCVCLSVCVCVWLEVPVSVSVPVCLSSYVSLSLDSQGGAWFVLGRSIVPWLASPVQAGVLRSGCGRATP